uniref:Uncharacterized protein n=1 Tax=Rhizophora mucronata TaxID=61149 RepID=A0A2P2IZQ2_RHIMU
MKHASLESAINVEGEVNDPYNNQTPQEKPEKRLPIH